MSRYIPKTRTALPAGTRVRVMAASVHGARRLEPAEVVADNGAGPVQVRWMRPRAAGQLGLVDRRRIRLVAKPAEEVQDGK